MTIWSYFVEANAVFLQLCKHIYLLHTQLCNEKDRLEMINTLSLSNSSVAACELASALLPCDRLLSLCVTTAPCWQFTITFTEICLPQHIIYWLIAAVYNVMNNRTILRELYAAIVVTGDSCLYQLTVLVSMWF